MFLDINYFLNKKYIQLKKVINSFIDLWLTEEMDTYTTSIKKPPNNELVIMLEKIILICFCFCYQGLRK